MEGSASQRRNMWAFGTREIVYAAIGAALYGVLNWVFNSIQIPGTTLVSVRPPVAIPFFMGVVFGPWVGFFTGFVGNIIGDLLSGYGFFWNWDVGNGLLGLVMGLVGYLGVREVVSGGDYGIVEVMVIVASFVGIGFAAFTDAYLLRNIDVGGAMTAELLPAAITDAINGLILTPILLYAWNAYRARSGR
jgi:energy-coupling factor transport system substrate-specific component